MTQTFTLQGIYTFQILFLTLCRIIFCLGSGSTLISPEVELDRLCLNRKPPKCLTIAELEEHDSLLDIFTNNTIFMTENELLVSFECKAPYPVEWVHSQEQWLTLVTNNWLPLLRTRIMKFTRIASNVHDPSTFEYSAVLLVTHVVGEFQYAVGQYKCYNVADPSKNTTSTTISVFSEGNVYEKAYALSGKNVTVWIGDADDNLVIFPCHVIFPGAAESAKFFKKIVRRTIRLPPRKLNFTGINRPNSILPNRRNPLQSVETWVELRPSQNFRFVAELGWIYDKSVVHFTKFPYPFKLSPGVFKCAMDEDNDDFVRIQLEPGKKPGPPIFDEPIKSNATVKYVFETNSTIIRVNCCSSSANPPKLFLIDCYNHFTCEQQKMHFESLDSQSQAVIPFVKATGSCMNSVTMSYQHFIPLNVRCVGDGINYSKSIYFPLVRHGLKEPYTSWEDVDPSKMLGVYPHGWDWRNNGFYTRPFTYYAGEKVRIECVTVTSYFSIGSKVEVELTNGSIIIAQEGAGHHELVKQVFGAYSLSVTTQIQTFFKSFSCYAPVLHSDRWIKKTVKLNVIAGHSPTILGNSNHENVFWTLNDTMKSLSCEFYGLPHPKLVEWNKDSVKIATVFSSNNHFNLTMLHENTSVLLIKLATYESHGIYTCTVTNVPGTATKTFQAYIRASETNWTIMSACLGIVCLISILTFLTYKTWRQKQVLDMSRGTFEGGGFAR